MSPEVQERIFEPFFTTKDVGEGTDWAWRPCMGSSQAMAGPSRSAVGVAVALTFTVYLPRAGKGPSASDTHTGARLPGAGCALMIDDEAMLVQLGCTQLKRLGYEAVGCTDSRVALDTFRAAPTRFDFVITDSTMPGMTGMTLAHELQRLRAPISRSSCAVARMRASTLSAPPSRGLPPYSRNHGLPRSWRAPAVCQSSQ